MYFDEIQEDYLLIKKSDIERLGKKALEEVYEYLNIDYSDIENTDKKLLSEIKKTKKDLDKLIIKELMKSKKTKRVKFCINEDEDQMTNSDLKSFYKNEIEKKIDDGSFDTKTIFNFLDKINFTWDMGEDAFCARNAFLLSYELFFHCYYELEE